MRTDAKMRSASSKNSGDEDEAESSIIGRAIVAGSKSSESKNDSPPDAKSHIDKSADSESLSKGGSGDKKPSQGPVEGPKGMKVSVPASAVKDPSAAAALSLSTANEEKGAAGEKVEKGKEKDKDSGSDRASSPSKLSAGISALGSRMSAGLRMGRSSGTDINSSIDSDSNYKNRGNEEKQGVNEKEAVKEVAKGQDEGKSSDKPKEKGKEESIEREKTGGDREAPSNVADTAHTPSSSALPAADGSVMSAAPPAGKSSIGSRISAGFSGLGRKKGATGGGKDSADSSVHGAIAAPITAEGLVASGSKDSLAIEKDADNEKNMDKGTNEEEVTDRKQGKSIKTEGTDSAEESKAQTADATVRLEGVSASGQPGDGKAAATAAGKSETDKKVGARGGDKPWLKNRKVAEPLGSGGTGAAGAQQAAETTDPPLEQLGSGAAGLPAEEAKVPGDKEREKDKGIEKGKEDNSSKRENKTIIPTLGLSSESLAAATEENDHRLETLDILEAESRNITPKKSSEPVRSDKSKASEDIGKGEMRGIAEMGGRGGEGGKGGKGQSDVSADAKKDEALKVQPVEPSNVLNLEEIKKAVSTLRAGILASVTAKGDTKGKNRGDVGDPSLGKGKPSEKDKGGDIMGGGVKATGGEGVEVEDGAREEARRRVKAVFAALDQQSHAVASGCVDYDEFRQVT